MRRASGWRWMSCQPSTPSHLAQHRRMRAPAVPQELDHRDDDRQHDALDRAQQQHAGGAADGQPELPGLDAADALQVAPFDQPHHRGDDHRGQRAVRQLLQQLRRQQQQRRHAERADHAGHLRARTRGLGHRRARRAAADREALEQAHRQVGRAQRRPSPGSGRPAGAGAAHRCATARWCRQRPPAPRPARRPAPAAGRPS